MTGLGLIHHHKSSHVRSSSDPQLPNPVLLRIEEELHNLRVAAASSPSSSHVVSRALTKLCRLYMSVDELYCLTPNQKAINHRRNGKWVEEQLDDSIQFLDLIGALRECVALIKEHILDIQLSLVRIKDESSCVVSEKMLMKQIKHSSKMLRHYGDNHHKSSVFPGDQDLVMAERVMVETRKIINGLFKSVLGFLLLPSLKLKANNKVSKWGRAECWKLEGSELKELEESMEELEKGLEELFRKLIHHRVSLLNILSL